LLRFHCDCVPKLPSVSYLVLRLCSTSLYCSDIDPHCARSSITRLFQFLSCASSALRFASLCRIGRPLLAPILDFFWFVLFHCGFLTIETPQTHHQSVNTESIKSMGQHHMSCSCGNNWDLPSSDHIKNFRPFEYLKCIVYCPICESQYYCILFACLTSKLG
jgi:hypothetical protein